MGARLIKNESWDRLGDLTAAMGTTMARDVQRAMDRRMKTEVLGPLAERVKAAANGSHGEAAADSVRPKGGAKPGLTAGGKRAGGPLFYGSEFGGGPNSVRTSTYATTFRGGRQGVVTRHTTHQFRPHTGRAGYWFTPTVLDNTGWAITTLADIAARTIDEEF